MVLCIQANPCRSHSQLLLPRFHPQLNKSCSSQTPWTVLRPAAKNLPVLMLQQYKLSAKYPRRSHVCLLGGNDNSEGENEGSPMKFIENAFGSSKGKSLEDVLRDQMNQNNQELVEGGIGDFPPSDGGDGNGGEGGEGFEGPEDDDILDETLQVVLASVGFFLVYRYILDGEGMMKIVKDYFKFLFTGKQSVRLGKAFDRWEELRETVWDIVSSPWTKTIVKEDELWLERQIIKTQTVFDNPAKYKRMYRGKVGGKYVKAPRDNNDDEDVYFDDYY
ncbi:hypothetical protein LINGRAHAP2_LOCUS6994 [Linum grandiflorum]